MAKKQKIIRLPWVEGEPDKDGVVRDGWYCELMFTPVHGVMELVGLEVRSVRDPASERFRGVWNERVKRMRAETPNVKGADAPLRLQLKPRPLTKEVLRSLPLGRIVAAAKEADTAETWVKELERQQPERRAELERRVEAWQANKRPQRGGVPALPDEHYREVADTYNTAVEHDGYLAKPLNAVMERFGVSKSTATTWISRARHRGLVEPAAGRGLHAGWKEENR